MKKVVAFIILVALCLSFCACSPVAPEPKATIVNNEGVTEELTIAELRNIARENALKFETLYIGATITFEGTYSSIWTDYYLVGMSYNDRVNLLMLEEGVEVWVPRTKYLDLLEGLSAGDKIIISSQIAECSGTLVLRGCVDGGSWSKSSLEKTEIELPK